MQFFRKYNTAAKIRIPMPKAGSSDFALGADWTPVAGDVKVSKDGGVAANIETLPVVITMGNGAIWEFTISAVEMQSAELLITVVDAATKAVQDQGISVISFGNAAAGIVVDLSDAVSLGLSRLDAAISTRSSQVVVDALPTAEMVADQVWDEVVTDHAGLGSMGVALSVAGSPNDPWTALLPGLYGAGTAGKIIGDNINAAISSRSSQISVDDIPTNAELAVALAAADDVVLAALITMNNLAVGAAMTLTSGERAAVVAALFAAIVEGSTTFQQVMMLTLAASVGKTDGFVPGTVGTGHIRNVADTKNRITANYDANGNRTSITLDLT